MPDLNDLQYFAQVVRHGGFSAASRATGEPKAKLSKRVAQLERDLGVRLIERSTRSIHVTEIGRDVFAQCEVIAGGLEATEAIVARSRDEVRGSLRVSCPPQLPRSPVPLAEFAPRQRRSGPPPQKRRLRWRSAWRAITIAVVNRHFPGRLQHRPPGGGG